MSDPISNRPGDRLTENDLVALAQGGDVDAFERLASAHTDHLFTVVVRLVGDRGDAEDVVQEALLRAWRGIGQFHGRAMFFTWLYRIAVNEANRALEKRLRRGRSLDVDDESLVVSAPADQEPARQAERHELHAALDQAIGDLAAPYRTALVLRDIEGLSTREAAEIVGVGEPAFKSRLHQARMAIRAALGDATLLAGTS